MLLITNGYIKTMAGPDLEKGCILIGDDGKILTVGENLTAPDGAQIIDAQGRLVTPGCVDAHCHIGLDNEACGWEGMDYNEIVDPVTPHVRAIDSIYPMDESFYNAVKGGERGLFGCHPVDETLPPPPLPGGGLRHPLRPPRRHRKGAGGGRTGGRDRHLHLCQARPLPERGAGLFRQGGCV